MKIFANISWLFATLIIFIALGLIIPLHYIVPRAYSRKIPAWIIRLSIFLFVDVEGKEDPQAQMLLVNHQSDMDICIVETISKHDLTWVGKKELFDIPFFGLVLKLGEDISIERESKTSLLKLLKDAKKSIERNRVITMFPEGTRSSKGKMLPFKSGAKMVADKHKLKVQPIVLMQTSKYYNIKNFYYKPGRVKAIYMESFVADRSNPDWIKNLRIEMQKVYDDELANNPSHR